ncbi:hypothetical protein CAC42_4654 [Sphaceloma murrayae]|uniref:Uncharacterized protein n=1 Tax=Sphaceloma murrayae TaxID=2082308 RepID=A0A2K1QP65_9PEZI|nr:hypothetical protein CAC42_4654 [Sphaceloma murrayae]
MKNAPELRSLYRQILRELPLRPQHTNKLSNPSPLQKHIRQSIHSPSSASKPLATHVAELEQFVTYVKAQRTYLALLERYNPGMNMDEEERVRLTARRVGMDTSRLEALGIPKKSE